MELRQQQARATDWLITIPAKGRKKKRRLSFPSKFSKDARRLRFNWWEKRGRDMKASAREKARKGQSNSSYLLRHYRFIKSAKVNPLTSVNRKRTDPLLATDVSLPRPPNQQSGSIGWLRKTTQGDNGEAILAAVMTTSLQNGTFSRHPRIDGRVCEKINKNDRRSSRDSNRFHSAAARCPTRIPAGKRWDATFAVLKKLHSIVVDDQLYFL